MRGKNWLESLVIGLVLAGLISGMYRDAASQVIEHREGESNPGAVIFRTTLFGAATGLLAGGAYALVEEDDDLDTGEILKWSVAGGTAIGLAIGLVYLVARPEPQGDAEEVGDSGGDSAPRLALPSASLRGDRDALGKVHRSVDMSLLNIRF